MFPYLFEFAGKLVSSYLITNIIAAAIGFFVLWRSLKPAPAGTKGKTMLFGALIFLPFILGARLGAEIENHFFYANYAVSFKLTGQVSLWWGAAVAVAFSFPIASALKLNTFAVSDYFAPSIAIGGSISKLGCLLNGCCFGKPLQDANGFGIFYPEHSYPYSRFGWVPAHPVQLYESAAWLAVFIFIIFYRKKGRHFYGELFLLTILSYSAARFFSDFYRYSHGDGIISYSQAITAIVAFLTLTVWILRKKTREKQGLF